MSSSKLRSAPPGSPSAQADLVLTGQISSSFGAVLSSPSPTTDTANTAETTLSQAAGLTYSSQSINFLESLAFLLLSLFIIICALLIVLYFYRIREAGYLVRGDEEAGDLVETEREEREDWERVDWEEEEERRIRERRRRKKRGRRSAEKHETDVGSAESYAEMVGWRPPRTRKAVVAYQRL